MRTFIRLFFLLVSVNAFCRDGHLMFSRFKTFPDASFLFSETNHILSPHLSHKCVAFGEGLNRKEICVQLIRFIPIHFPHLPFTNIFKSVINRFSYRFSRSEESNFLSFIGHFLPLKDVEKVKRQKTFILKQVLPEMKS